MARLALQYMSNFPSSTNHHATNRPARSFLPTSAISFPSAHRAAINKVLVRFVLFVLFVRLRLYAADHLRKRKDACTIPLLPSHRDWPPDLREKEKRNRKRSRSDPKDGETTCHLETAQALLVGVWWCVSPFLFPPSSQPRKLAK